MHDASLIVSLAVRAIGVVDLWACNYAERVQVRELVAWVLIRVARVPRDRVGQLLACTGPGAYLAARRVDEDIRAGRADALVDLIALIAQHEGEIVLPTQRATGGRKRSPYVKRDGKLVPIAREPGRERKLLAHRIEPESLRVDAVVPIVERPARPVGSIPIVERDGCPSVRPCPFTRCPHHLPTSCVLDVVAQGPQETSAIAELMGLSDETVRTTLISGLRSMRGALGEAR